MNFASSATRPSLRRRLALASLLVCGPAASGVASAGTSEAGLPSGFVYLRDIAPDILQDMRYAGRNNFTGHRLPGYDGAECVLRRAAAKALADAQALVAKQGFTLKVYDCYRPARAVAAFAAWSRRPDDRSTKDYYPRLPKTGLYGKGYIATRSNHSRGCAVDLTLVRLPAAAQPAFDPEKPRAACTASQQERPFDTSVDMGTNFDCFDVRSHTDHPGISGEARANRDRLRRVLTKAGFRNYRREWWHYSYHGQCPKHYFDFAIPPHPTSQ